MINKVIALAKAELTQRVRQPALWQLLFVTILLATLFLPSTNSSYIVLGGDTKAALPTASVSGTISALLLSFIFLLVGPFMARGGVYEDRETKVMELIISSDLKPALYLLGKWLTAFTLLLLVAVLSQLTVMVAFLWRGEGPLLFSAFINPLLYSSCIVAFLSSTLAIVWDIYHLYSRRGVAILYLIFSLLFISIGMIAKAPEPTGLGDYINQLQTEEDVVGLSLGFIARTPQQQPVTLPGWAIDQKVITRQLIWVAVSLLLGVLVLLSWREEVGFRPQLATKKEKGGHNEVVPISPVVRPMPPVTANPTLFSLISAELLASWPRSRWFTITTAMLWIVPFLIPFVVVQNYLIPIALLLNIVIVAELPVRENQHGVEGLLFSLPHTKKQYRLWKGGTGMLATLLINGGILLSALWHAPTTTAPTLLASQWLTVGWLLLAGYKRNNSLLGLLSLTVFWYLACWNPLPRWFDYGGVHGGSADVALLYALLGLLCFVIVGVLHRRLVINE